MDAAEPVFTFLFTLEMLTKIVAMGFFLDARSYLRDGWNVLDFTVVVVRPSRTREGMDPGTDGSAP